MMEMFRVLVRRERDQAAQDRSQPNRLKEFSYGLIYDALGWTTRQVKVSDLDTLLEVLRIAEQPVVSEEDFMAVRNILVQGDFNVSPPIEDMSHDPK